MSSVSVMTAGQLLVSARLPGLGRGFSGRVAIQSVHIPGLVSPDPYRVVKRFSLKGGLHIQFMYRRLCMVSAGCNTHNFLS